MELGLRGKTCVVTGGTRGIGLACARALCVEGARVCVVGRDEERVAAAVEACRADEPDSGETLGVAVDVCAADAAERVEAACRERFGPVDVLVNNAGQSRRMPLLELDEERDWDGQWQVNVLAPWRFMRLFVPQMADRGWGRVVNVSSAAARTSSPTNAAYAATKVAELSLSRAFANEFAGRGVLVNAVTPGAVSSDMWMAEGGLADQIAVASGADRGDVLAQAQARAPLGRFGTEEEIAWVIAFLCSERAANVVGAAWAVDGGFVPSIM